MVLEIIVLAIILLVRVIVLVVVIIKIIAHKIRGGREFRIRPRACSALKKRGGRGGGAAPSQGGGSGGQSPPPVIPICFCSKLSFYTPSSSPSGYLSPTSKNR